MTIRDAAASPAPGAIRAAVLAAPVLIALTAAVWLVHVFGRTLPTPALAAAWAAATGLIAVGLFRRARVRRAAFIAAYLNADSPLARRLRGGPVLAARTIVTAAALALVLLVAVVRLDDPRAWLVLVAVGISVPFAHALTSAALRPHASAAYLPELAWRVTAALVGAAAIAALAAIAFHRPQPELGGVTLERAVWHFVDAERARSRAADALLEIAAAADALRLWTAQQLMPRPGASLAQAAGWLALLAEEALFVWSYLSICSPVVLRSAGR